jgi:hypothetical protein
LPRKTGVVQLRGELGAASPFGDVAVFFHLDETQEAEIERVEELLREHNPWPEGDLSRLSKVAADTPDSEQRFAEYRRTVLDIDSLLQDARWGVGNALLMIRGFPNLAAPLSDVESRFDHIGIPARVHLLISGLIVDRDRVIFRDPMERQPGGKTVGRWMVRLLCDHVVNCSIAVLDRLAQLLVLGHGVAAPRNRMYFRTGKLEVLRSELGLPIPDRLLEIAGGEELEFLLSYRDGMAHTQRVNTTALGVAAVDEYVDATGESVRVRAADWSPEELLGISLMAFTATCDALHEVADYSANLLGGGT